MCDLKESILSNQYVAGLFDGEGCVYCQRQWIKGKYEKYPRVSIQISVTNNHFGVLELLKEWFGGGSYKNGNNDKAFEWRVCGKKDLLRFLRAIYPHSVIKKFEIGQAIKFAETIREQNLGCVPLTKREHGVREQVYNSLRKNKNKKKYERTFRRENERVI